MGTPRGRHQARGPPGTSAPTTRTWCRPVVRTHGRARRPRRAAYTETPRGRHQARGPPGTSAPTTRHMVPARTTHPMVGRDVLGAPRTRGRHRGRHRERPQPRGPPGTSAPTTRHMVPARSTNPMVGRDVPGAPRTRGTPSGARAAGDVGPYHAPHGAGPYHARTHLHTGWGPVSASRAEGGAGTSRTTPSATGYRNPKVSRRRRKRSQTSRSQNEKSDIIAP